MVEDSVGGGVPVAGDVGRVPCDAVKWSWRAKLFSGRYFMVVAVMSTVCYCTATAIQIPNELWVIAGMIATHYFDKEVMKG